MTLIKYLTLTTKRVEQLISEDLPNKFGILYDDWTTSGVHYVAVYGVYSKGMESRYPLLAISPLLEEDDLGKSLQNNVCFLIGDNCSTNKVSQK